MDGVGRADPLRGDAKGKEIIRREGIASNPQRLPQLPSSHGGAWSESSPLSDRSDLCPSVILTEREQADTTAQVGYMGITQSTARKSSHRKVWGCGRRGRPGRPLTT
eukprot:GHVN01040098.1.p2 GENE.GHVN01040098.1~~GHVN01040098.1.p2  ORF type:complete len:107 (+),score=12.40 GHVN01040098.1:673-993(+)